MEEFINYISLLDKEIAKRYKTLEKNIKNISNSYYDSYLDLFEATLKAILNKEGIQYDHSKTFGDLVKNNNGVKAFLTRIGVVDKSYDKIGDYTKKVNDHKHKSEKNVSKEAVINQMRAYYDFMAKYFSYSNDIKFGEFDEEYYSSIFGENERKHKKLEEELKKALEQANENASKNEEINEALNEYKERFENNDSKFDDLEKANKDLEEKIEKLNEINNIFLDSMNQKLDNINKKIDGIVNTSKEEQYKYIKQRQYDDSVATKRFILDSNAYYFWTGSTKDFKQSKKNVISFLLTTISLGLISTVFTSLAFKMYSVLSIIENLYIIVSLISIYKINNSSKQIFHADLATYSNMQFEITKEGIYVENGLAKKSYRMFRIILLIIIAMNIICMFALGDNVLISIIAALFEIGFAISSLISSFKFSEFYGLYGPFIIFKNKKTQQNLVFDSRMRKYYSYEEFEEKFKILL